VTSILWRASRWPRSVPMYRVGFSRAAPRSAIATGLVIETCSGNCAGGTVNETGTGTDDYRGFDGKGVIVTGFALRCDDLPVGDTVADQTFTRRYYHGKQVHNFCNRPLVFVANKIELQG
jgi:hypothetical protein